MKNATARVVFAVIVVALGGIPAGASAAEIKALATIALQSVLEDLAPRFEKANGHKVNITSASASLWRNACRTARPWTYW